jgi:hypothetical protein
MARRCDRERMSAPFGRFVLVGAIAAGVLGAIVGLIVGLYAYPPTAPFAVLELGIPGALAGAVLGVIVGAVVSGTRWARARGCAE